MPVRVVVMSPALRRTVVCWLAEGSEMPTRSAVSVVVAGWRRLARTAARVRPSRGVRVSAACRGCPPVGDRLILKSFYNKNRILGGLDNGFTVRIIG